MKTDGQRGNSFAKEFPFRTPFQKTPIRCEKAQAGERLASPHTSASRIMLKEFLEDPVSCRGVPSRVCLRSKGSNTYYWFREVL